MKISELQTRIDRAISRMESEIDTVAARAGSDIVALVTRRVIEKGLNSEEQSFSPYSPEYKKFREKKNRNTGFKSFEFTGSMFRGFQVIAVQRTSTGVRITIGGSNQDSADKIEWNSKREKKSIIKPTRKELEFAQNSLNNWLKSIVNG